MFIQRATTMTTPETPYALADITVGIFLITLCFFGAFGNSLALFFFYAKGQRKGSVHNMLYAIISGCDTILLITMMLYLPTLLTNRAEMLFGNSTFCISFVLVLMTLGRFTWLMVVTISTCRTICIIFPHYVMRARTIEMGLVAYFLMVVFIDILGLALGWQKTRFFITAASCVYIRTEAAPAWFKIFWTINILTQFIIPSILIFASFLVSTVALLKRTTIQNETDKTFRRASITITLFTAVFLFCNIPCFAFQIIFTISLITMKQINNHFLTWYGLMVLQILATALNSAVNPCLYFLRMKKFKTWTRNKLYRRPTDSEVYHS